MYQLVILTIIVFAVQQLGATNGVTSPTGALLTFPLDGALYGLTNMTVTPAEFGIHVYGGNVAGLLVIAADPVYRTQCPPRYGFNSTQEPIGINGYLSAVNNFNFSIQEKWIMMIDRGDCFFVDKVKHAESLGADAVIVVDNIVESNLVVMWPPESFVQNSINIPSVFLDETNGALIYKKLGVTGFNLYGSKANLTYPNPHNYPKIRASIEWGLPHPDDVVEWEIWTSSDDKMSRDFFPFGEISENLTLSHDAIFTPHYVILDGTHWGCTAPNLPCGAQCTNSGRYCAEDPERDLQKGITGRAVVQENLRQMCVFEYANNTLHDYLLWWEYVRAFHTHCYDVPNYQNTYNPQCSFQQMDAITNNKNMRNFVETCIAVAGGYNATSGVNSRLAAEISLRESSGSYISPTESVNGFHIYGRMSCPIPIQKSTCQIFQAICAGYLEGTEPAICLANTATCSGNYDCKGICNGYNVMDACQRCLPINSTQRDACLAKDCNGEIRGPARINPCGICANFSMPNWNKLGRDCSNQCGGTNVLDRCNVCLQPLNRQFDACVGCDNVPFSNLTYDCAGQCGGPHTIINCPGGVVLCVNPNDPQHAHACELGINATWTPAQPTGTSASQGAPTNIILIILSVVALLLVIVVLGIMYKNRQDTNERFNQLINQYQPLENDPQHGAAVSSQIQETKGELQEDTV